jgi:hypothetical protein
MLPLLNRVRSKQADWRSTDSFDIHRRERREIDDRVAGGEGILPIATFVSDRDTMPTRTTSFVNQIVHRSHRGMYGRCGDVSRKIGRGVIAYWRPAAVYVPGTNDRRRPIGERRQRRALRLQQLAASGPAVVAAAEAECITITGIISRSAARLLQLHVQRDSASLHEPAKQQPATDRAHIQRASKINVRGSWM